MSQLDNILEGLIERTTNGTLKWSRTVESNQFVTSVDTISVVVRELPVGGWVIPTSYRLEILDEMGETIEVIGPGEESNNRTQQVGRLYILARHSALDVQSTLAKLAKALES